MLLRPAPSRRVPGIAIVLPWCAALPMLVVPAVTRGQPAVEAEPATDGQGLVVPAVPDGTPEELMKFAEGLRQPKSAPKSRQEMMAYMQGVAAASVQVADKIFAQAQPGDAVYAKAARLKLESLGLLKAMGNEQAGKDMEAYAATLAEGPDPELAKQARLMLVAAELQQVARSGEVGAVPGLVKKVGDMVAADPDDTQVAGLAMQFAGMLEHMPGGEAAAVQAYETFGPLLAKSTNPQVQRMGESFAGVLRRLSLPGKPMEIKGTRLDGEAFDQGSLAGKVVLVDFWATWCGPCRAEIPNMKQEYEKYHDKGFEVVGISLDRSRDALEKFVKKEEIPWTILYDEGEAGQAMARQYGISGIPQLILIGRDGNVITLNARGPQLGEELEKLFKDAG